MTLEFLHKCLPAININKMFDKPIKPENYLELLDACDKLESMNDLTVIHVFLIVYREYEQIENAPLFSSLSFSSVYWYSHILEALPCEEIDHKFYMNQRKEQLLLIFNYNQAIWSKI
ncbi:hypothetical protein HZS_2449 [Henneguya salminicola]|nr:hypothetical protein HZS_2449 [Henneguya salminicola]